MLKAPRIGKKSRQRVKKIAALAFLLCFILVSLFSQTLILTSAHHEHDQLGADGGCVACVHLSAAINILKSLFAALSAAAFASWCFSALLSLVKPSAFHTDSRTLVKMKIRLNN
ncbi:MAG: hypothetical protein FWE85_04855 [Clostridiales bacterium]|nr:hypothetical protein [Clostridiales bacterium]